MGMLVDFASAVLVEMIKVGHCKMTICRVIKGKYSIRGTCARWAQQVINGVHGAPYKWPCKQTYKWASNWDIFTRTFCGVISPYLGPGLPGAHLVGISLYHPDILGGSSHACSY